MPVLGLSNKVADTQSSPDAQGNAASGPTYPEPRMHTMALDGDEPPTEDLLARHTLWPEHEKLYGHGYEISEAVSNDNGTVLATACKASSVDHAVIRMYDTRDWHEIKPPLVAHSLTVTRLAFSHDDRGYLLSVGRDRQWTVLRQDEDNSETWKTFQSFPKAHSRMILDAAWSPVRGHTFFATGGRDKLVKLWHLINDGPQQQFTLVETITRRSAVTAISFTSNRDQSLACLAVGEEDGLMSFHVFALENVLSLLKSWGMDTLDCPAKSVTRIQWRPESEYETSKEGTHLAVAAADGSVRIFLVDWEESFKEASKDLGV
jgi:elongator complex protein 2